MPIIKPHGDTFVTRFGATALRILNDKFQNIPEHEKEDVIQNVFIKLLRNGLRNFNGISSYEFFAYFKKIVVNEALTWLKSPTIRNRLISLDHKREFEDTELPSFYTPSQNPSLDNIVEIEQFLRLIDEMLKEYPMLDRQIFLLKAQGHKDKEIANILKVPMGTVASKYARMKEKVEHMLDGLK